MMSTPASVRSLTVVIVDDHAMVRDGLRLLLEAEGDLEVVAEAADPEGAVRYVRGHDPDVLVLDLNLAGGSAKLSAREVEVLRLIALGHTGREIGTLLVISPRTVESHRNHLQQKLRCSTRAELVGHALEHGLLDPPTG